jgi:hypothetical protein
MEQQTTQRKVVAILTLNYFHFLQMALGVFSKLASKQVLHAALILDIIIIDICLHVMEILVLSSQVKHNCQ